MRTLTQWQEDIHNNAIEKGWFEKDRPSLELHALMVAEISEALEEVRKHKEDFYMVGDKPEGEAIELVDYIIRIFDYTNYKKVDIENYLNLVYSQSIKGGSASQWSKIICAQKHSFKWYTDFKELSNQLEKHQFFTITLSQASSAVIEGDMNKELAIFAVSLGQIFVYFEENNWDIEKLLEVKHTYNMSRPYKHGGKKH